MYKFLIIITAAGFWLGMLNLLFEETESTPEAAPVVECRDTMCERPDGTLFASRRCDDGYFKTEALFEGDFSRSTCWTTAKFTR